MSLDDQALEMLTTVVLVDKPARAFGEPTTTAGSRPSGTMPRS